VVEEARKTGNRIRPVSTLAAASQLRPESLVRWTVARVPDIVITTPTVPKNTGIEWRDLGGSAARRQ